MEPGRLNRFAQGFRYGLPIMLGYFPVSFAFAVSAVASGLPWPLVVLISRSNFTSAGQQAGAGLLIRHAPLPEIGVTVLIKRLLIANGVTDEIFFLAMRKDGTLSGWFLTGLAAGPYGGWVLGTLAGALAGAVLPASLSSALGIALYAMFIAIITPAARDSHPIAAVALQSGCPACSGICRAFA